MKPKRDINSLPTWDDFEKKLLKNPEFRKEMEKQEPEFQVQRALIKLRIKEHLTQKQLAKRIGTKQPVLSRIENGTVTPTLDILQRIADAVGARLIVKFAY